MPAIALVTCSPSPINGSNPAGVVSVRIQINPVIASAKSASQGSHAGLLADLIIPVDDDEK